TCRKTRCAHRWRKSSSARPSSTSPTTSRSFARRVPRTARRTTRGVEPPMTDMMGLPEPPAVGATALPLGTFDGTAVFVTGAGTGLGKAIASEFARLGAAIVIASRKPEHLAAGHEAITELGAPVRTVACDIRDPEQITAAFDE